MHPRSCWASSQRWRTTARRSELLFLLASTGGVRNSPLMANVPGLRSPYKKVGRLVYFGRMLDKIRLHAAGKLPGADYSANLGKGFDARCCSFLRIDYEDLKTRVLAGD